MKSLSIKTFLLLTFGVGPQLACGQNSSSDASASNGDTHPGWSYFQQYCTGCHGKQGKGGSGGPLVNTEYQHGGNREDLFRTIHDGINTLGMPTYGGVLTDDQVYLIADALLGNAPPQSTAKAERKSGDQVKTLDYKMNVEEWVTGLSTPWGMEFLTPDVVLVTEKSGSLRLITKGVLSASPIKGTPKVTDASQGGLLDVEKHPKYAENGWIYLSFSHMNDQNNSMTKVVRGKLDGLNWVDEETIFEAPAETYLSTRHHYGNRLNFGPDGMLYFSIGDRGRGEKAQNLALPNGKVHRVNPDGTIPEDNPFLGTAEAMASTWTYGHRNQQGMAFHPITGDLWAAEHGPRGGDELNLIQPGLNYGWPEITYGINYNGTVITKERVRPGFEQPAYFWRPSIAVCGIEFYTGDEFPLWRNQLLVTSLANQTIRLLHIQNQRVLHEEVILRDRGRIRDAITGPDGAIYVVLNDPGQILRLSSIEEDLQ